MTGPEHYREAERLLNRCRRNAVTWDLERRQLVDGDDITYAADDGSDDLIAAQVHATLALAAASAYPAVRTYLGDAEYEQREWASVTAPAPKPRLVKCPQCDGQGVVAGGGPDYFGNQDSADCSLCRGDGEVTADVAAKFEDDKAAAS